MVKVAGLFWFVRLSQEQITHLLKSIKKKNRCNLLNHSRWRYFKGGRKGSLMGRVWVKGPGCVGESSRGGGGGGALTV